MYKSDNARLQDYGDYIINALRTEGGHLSIGRGGFILWFGRRCRLSGYDCEHIKASCIAAGLPVIDSRIVAFEDVVRLAVSGPMVAVGEGLAEFSAWLRVDWETPAQTPAVRAHTTAWTWPIR